MERLSSETNVPTDPVPHVGVFLVESRLSSLHPHMVESKEAESQFSLSFCKGTNAMVRAPSPDLVAWQRPSTHELGAQIFNPWQREFAPVSDGSLEAAAEIEHAHSPDPASPLCRSHSPEMPAGVPQVTCQQLMWQFK